MLTIYLDQNKWIDLARAATGHALGGRFRPALASVREAVASGSAVLPLDMYRYSETGRRRDAQSRHEVADLMWELSHQVTIASSRDLLPVELDHALFRRFGRPEHPRQAEPFGMGVAHITSGKITLPGPDPKMLAKYRDSIPADRVAEFHEVFRGVLEAELLRGGPELVPAALARAIAEIDQDYVKLENTIAANIQDRKLEGDLLELAVRASDLGGIQDAVTAALEQIDLTWDEFITDLGPAGLSPFMDDLPTRYVTNVMRSAKLRQTEQLWEPNDFNDVLALSVAAVYCDVVVTEKQWVHHLRRGKVHERYGTLLLSDVADLVRIVGGGK